MGSMPWQNVFQRQRPVQCSKCGYVGAPHPTKFGCVDTCPHDNGGTPPNGGGTPPNGGGGTPPSSVPPTFTAQPGGNGNGGSGPVPIQPPPNNRGPSTMVAPNGNGTQAHPLRPNRAQSWPMQWPNDCPPSGAPYPCPGPYMNPKDPSKVFGCPLPCEQMRCGSWEEAVKQLCWLETTLRSVTPVDVGATITFGIEVKWWWQPQKVQNLGDQDAATFDLVDIAYGQSNYNLEIKEYSINGTPVQQNGIDIRRWNQGLFSDKFYPFPASGLNDPIELTFLNVGAAPADIELLLGGPGVLQIG